MAHVYPGPDKQKIDVARFRACRRMAEACHAQPWPDPHDHEESYKILCRTAQVVNILSMGFDDAADRATDP